VLACTQKTLTATAAAACAAWSAFSRHCGCTRHGLVGIVSGGLVQYK
jgi:hypothetical protein